MASPVIALFYNFLMHQDPAIIPDQMKRFLEIFTTILLRLARQPADSKKGPLDIPALVLLADRVSLIFTSFVFIL